MSRNPSSSSPPVMHPVDLETSNPNRVVAHTENIQFKNWFAWIVPTFVIANVAMFVITMYINNCPKNSANCVATVLGRFAFQPTKENALFGPSSSTLQKIGGLVISKVIDKHEGWRLLSCNWLHAGVVHLLLNMLTLLLIGFRLEREFGFIRIGLLYVISGFGGSLLSALFLRSNVSVGASGAVFGLLGGMLSELIMNWTIYTDKAGAFVTLLILVAVNLAVGIIPYVDNFAHIGGFVTGFLVGFVFLIRPQFGWVKQKAGSQGYSTISGIPRTPPKFKIYQCVLWGLSLILLVVGLTIALVMLLRGVDGNKHCSWCHYLSCVPTSRWSCNTEPAFCTTDQLGSQLNITCSTNGNTGTYLLPSFTDSQIQSLCSELCN